MGVTGVLLVGAMLVGGTAFLVMSGLRTPGDRPSDEGRPARNRGASDQRELVEAVATWAEHLRDTMSAASGLEQAIISTEHHAPRAIAPAVRRLVASLRYGSLEDGLRRFADDVGHPTCDFVVAALVAASQHQTRDVALLLGHLADCARSECALYLRIWVSRARSRAAVRIISAAVAVFTLGLVLLNPGYLQPFVSPTGAAVLVVVVGCFAGALLWLNDMARVRTPARFLSGREAVAR